jgi:transcriptional regulator with XRE-family HTH domain
MDKRAKQIRELRTLAGLTQFDVAKRVRIERSRLSLVENGHVRLTGDEYDAIESALRPVALQRVVRNRLFKNKVRPE